MLRGQAEVHPSGAATNGPVVRNNSDNADYIVLNVTVWPGATS